MKKIFFIYIIISALVATAIVVAIVCLSPKNQPPINTNEDASQQSTSGLEEDLFPLYSGVNWSQPTLLQHSETSNEWQVTSDIIPDQTNIYAVTQPFTDYYEAKLTGLDWSHDMMREASGPGSNVSYYTKDNRFIILAFQSDFKIKNENAPVECPCDIHFTITSGTE